MEIKDFFYCAPSPPVVGSVTVYYDFLYSQCWRGVVTDFSSYSALLENWSPCRSVGFLVSTRNWSYLNIFTPLHVISSSHLLYLVGKGLESWPTARRRRSIFRWIRFLSLGLVTLHSNDRKKIIRYGNWTTYFDWASVFYRLCWSQTTNRHFIWA